MTEYNEILENAYKVLKQYNKTDTVYSHSEIVELAEYVCNNPKFKKYKDLILNKIIDRYEENITTKGYDPDVLSLDSKDSEWFFNAKGTIATPYFDRYAQYLSDQDFAEDTIAKIEKSTETILSKCADPKNQTLIKMKKRGLVVGDVQSGKTANYLALINLACDYGYKLIVLLAGMTESLRKQTQKRIDSGFIGATSETIGASDIQYIGVGLEETKYYSVPYTNGKYDFNKVVKENNNSSVSDFNKPVVLVVKKNSSVLKHVIDALKAKEGKLDRENVLIIDDEADNASINTNNPDKDPTKINNSIRKIFNNYSIATYVGFTATPYANIFINPEETDDYLDLFPSDFIVQLNAPDNYFGGQKVFGNEGVLRIIHDYENNFLPTKHKKDFTYCGLSDSLIEAINCFIINNVLRTLDGAEFKHRSMLINISVYNDIQYKVHHYVEKYIEKLIAIFDQDGHKETNELIRNKYAKRLYDLYTSSDFYDNEKAKGVISWQIIQKKILSELQLIKSMVFNNSNKNKFTYDDYPYGARIIAIGGYVLSRGLTLEGLMVSYYNRSTATYDTMLQMCRWFGYKPKYEHLCRVYLTESNKENFIAVLDATKDLREQFLQMKMRDAKPIDFGLMVKESPDSLDTKLLVTARNKLKGTEEFVRTLNYSGVVADTSKIIIDKNSNDFNRQELLSFILQQKEIGLNVEKIDDRYLIRNVNKNAIALFIKKIKVSYYNTKFDTDSLSDYIFNGEFDNWDIVFASGKRSDKTYKCNGYEIIAPIRSFVYEEHSTVIKIGGSNNRMVDPGIFNAGLSQEQKEQAKLNAVMLYNQGLRRKKDVIARDLLDIKGRKPVLVIYPLDIKANDPTNDSAKNIEKKFKDELLYGFAIGFPGKDFKVIVKYRANKIKLNEITRGFTHLDEEEEEYDYD